MNLIPSDCCCSDDIEEELPLNGVGSNKFVLLELYIRWMVGNFSVVALNNQSYLDLQSRANAKLGNSKNSSSFLKATTTTLLHTISETEKASYVAHINSYLRDDPFLKQFLPIDPSTNALFDLAKDGVLLWYFKLTTLVFRT